MKQSSQRYVDFIGNLMPLYQQEQVHDQRCARSLRDGSLLIPRLEIEENQDDHWVTVWWQGDCKRSSEVDGTQLASIALVDYVQFHSAGKPEEAISCLLEQLNQHFTFKTGGSLYLPYAGEQLQAFGKVLSTVKRYGPDLAWDVLKKSLGL